MIICKCDRCGKEETINTVYPYLFGDEGHKPRFFITKNEGANVKMIHLCPDCENAFEEFIKPVDNKECRYYINNECKATGLETAGDGWCYLAKKKVDQSIFKVGDKVKVKEDAGNDVGPELRGKTLIITNIFPWVEKGVELFEVEFLCRGHKYRVPLTSKDVEKVEEK